MAALFCRYSPHTLVVAAFLIFVVALSHCRSARASMIAVQVALVSQHPRTVSLLQYTDDRAEEALLPRRRPRTLNAAPRSPHGGILSARDSAFERDASTGAATMARTGADQRPLPVRARRATTTGVQDVPSFDFQKTSRPTTKPGLVDAMPGRLANHHLRHGGRIPRRRRLPPYRTRSTVPPTSTEIPAANETLQNGSVVAGTMDSVAPYTPTGVMATGSPVEATTSQATAHTTARHAPHNHSLSIRRELEEIFGITQCERSQHYIAVTSPGCQAKQFDVGACGGFCRSWYLPLFVDEGVTPESWFRRDKCKCCTHHRTQTVEVTLTCEENREVTLQVPKVVKCHCTKCRGT